ncbi:hypothetical protein IHE45_09G080900 [Dioscorea alata]|uniref:Uncharacterized protein n=1 Tax=Dioscorea alata TaxID=55571 RepID=A0ACB7VFV5_DIOAL|nr:hypothetical protein IHE45_09G080900 [Dioscorea alata]
MSIMNYPTELCFMGDSMYYRAILHVNFNSMYFSKCYLCGCPPMSHSFYTLDERAGLGVHAACALYAAYMIFAAPKGISMPSLPPLPSSSYSYINQQVPQLMNNNYYSAQPPPPTTFNYCYSSGYKYQEQPPQYMNYYHSAPPPPPPPPSTYNYASGYSYYQSTKYIVNASHYIPPPPSTIIVNSNNNGYGGPFGIVRNFLKVLSNSFWGVF